MRKTNALYLMGTAALIAGALAPPVFAQQAPQPLCGDHATITGNLAERWGESRQTIALGSNGVVFESYANLESGTWTLLLTDPEGRTCLVADGGAFELVNEPLDLSEGT